MNLLSIYGMSYLFPDARLIGDFVVVVALSFIDLCLSVFFFLVRIES